MNNFEYIFLFLLPYFAGFAFIMYGPRKSWFWSDTITLPPIKTNQLNRETSTSRSLDSGVYHTSVVSSESTLGSIENIMAYRLKNYKNYCRKKFGQLSAQDNDDKLRSLLTDGRARHQYTFSNSFKFIECRIPKTGSAQRAKWYWPVFHSTPYPPYVPPHPTSDKQVPKMDILSLQKTEEKLESFTSFMFVRDPIVRFISGYLNKVYSQKFEGRPILKEARMFLNDTDLSKPLTIADFSKYIAGLYDMGKQIPNKHFSGYFNLCGQCTINYTFIGRTETLRRDFTFIVKNITNLSKRVQIPNSNWTTSSENNMKLLRFIDREDLKKIIKTFEDEFAAFGYDENDVWRFLDEI